MRDAVLAESRKADRAAMGCEGRDGIESGRHLRSPSPRSRPCAIARPPAIAAAASLDSHFSPPHPLLPEPDLGASHPASASPSFQRFFAPRLSRLWIRSRVRQLWILKSPAFFLLRCDRIGCLSSFEDWEKPWSSDSGDSRVMGL
jgi:hypothetical protein